MSTGASMIDVFQSTPPHGGRPMPHRDIADGDGFNPRPRMGGDTSSWQMHDANRVSIHAPAWGATRHSPLTSSTRHVSIHAPAWGATDYQWHAVRLPCVSIHAPAWGATAHVDYARCDMVSIHAPAWGATVMTARCHSD